MKRLRNTPKSIVGWAPSEKGNEKDVKIEYRDLKENGAELNGTPIKEETI